MSELKNCPFCGTSPDTDGVVEFCPSCLAETTDLWNTRPTEDRLRRERDEARSDLDTMQEEWDKDLLKHTVMIRAQLATTNGLLDEVEALRLKWVDLNPDVRMDVHYPLASILAKREAK